MRILVVEDNPYRIKSIRQALIGKVVDIATTASRGIELFKSKEYDAVLLDHDLGGIENAPSDDSSGYAVAQAVAESGKEPFVIIHSCNPAGASRMQDELPWAVKVPYIRLLNDPNFLSLTV